MKIGILGGTFNPIHIGHLILAENAYYMVHLDQVLFVPSGVSYLKDQSRILPSADRLRMVELAVASNPHFAVSTIETDREGNSYTYETLSTLKAGEPDNEYYLIGGADILMSIHTWVHPEKIFENAVLVIAPRDLTKREDMERQKTFLEEQYGADVRLLTSTELDISSHAIRERLSEGKSVRYYIPDPVLDYIKQHELYI